MTHTREGTRLCLTCDTGVRCHAGALKASVASRTLDYMTRLARTLVCPSPRNLEGPCLHSPDQASEVSLCGSWALGNKEEPDTLQHCRLNEQGDRVQKLSALVSASVDIGMHGISTTWTTTRRLPCGSARWMLDVCYAALGTSRPRGLTHTAPIANVPTCLASRTQRTS